MKFSPQDDINYYDCFFQITSSYYKHCANYYVKYYQLLSVRETNWGKAICMQLVTHFQKPALSSKTSKAEGVRMTYAFDRA
ncbi:MAG: hypothetical protein CL584_00555 [Alteromonadaceae bacterium]|nr:hypothetical protein [Alteromonadaceae bacterium]|tara:strand:+ start:21877 stop:22119 length:243 start_codon:yes stop_codon:yes gene_type:complete